MLIGLLGVTERSNAAERIVYWQGAASDARKPYEAELIKLLIRLSEPKFGAVTLTVSQRPMTTERALSIIHEGRNMHVLTAPHYFGEQHADAVNVLPYNVMDNLLGYRQLIVRQADLAKIKSISTFEQFKPLVAGQGSGWADIEVYHANALRVTQANNFDVLFPMLKAERFDYLALGLGEASSTYNRKHLDDQGLVMVDGLLIFYPWPVHIMVSQAHPQLTQRFEYGMQQALSNGEFQALFDKHFAEIIRQYNRDDVNIIVLNTPGLEASGHTAPTLLPKAKILQAAEPQTAQ